MTVLPEGFVLQNQNEIDVFNTIKDDVDVVLDIGCREEYGYALLKPEAEFYLFDVNPQFISTINEKIEGRGLNVKTFSYGLASQNGSVQWSANSESIQGHRLWGKLSTFEVRKFDEVLEENDIKNIDFIKMDIEGSEPDILAFHDIIENVKYIQFECGLTWSDLDNFSFKDTVEQYKESHDAFFIKDDNHPMCGPDSDVLTPITEEFADGLYKYLRQGAGMNILLAKKGLID